MKTAIITGVSQGLGRCIASAFATAGWRVVGTGRSSRPDGLDQAIEYHRFDASDADAVADFWGALKLSDGEVCLVNNAGGYMSGGLVETQPEDYATQMQSNYFAGVYMTRGLVEHVPGARIINVISGGALEVHPNDSAYGAAKAAAAHFFHAIQKEYAVEQYPITNLYPSNIASHGTAPNAIDPEDLAAFVLELASSRDSYLLTDVTMRAIKRQ